MTPRSTVYRLACSPEEEQAARAFLDERLPSRTVEFPIITATREDRLVGVLATSTDQGAIVAGPLAVEGRSPFVALRLIDVYERIMRMTGVDAFYFHLAPEDNSWRRAVAKIGLEPFHQDAAGAWFKRSLPHAA